MSVGVLAGVDAKAQFPVREVNDVSVNETDLGDSLSIHERPIGAREILEMVTQGESER